MKSKDILAVLSVLVLLAAALRLAVLDKQQFQLYRISRKGRSTVMTEGSFVGIEGRGYKQQTTIDGDVHLLVFVVHHENVSGEVQYWNTVVRSLSLNQQVPAASIRYWGICDAGTECRAYEQEAQFSILGYTDPWEMHAAALADAQNEVLLYKAHNVLKARIPYTQDPLREAQLIAMETKSK